jgi:hypothetical protein
VLDKPRNRKLNSSDRSQFGFGEIGEEEKRVCSKSSNFANDFRRVNHGQISPAEPGGHVRFTKK